MSTPDPSGFSVKEILTLVIIPRLDQIEEAFQKKADRDAVDNLKRDLETKADRVELGHLVGMVKELQEKAITSEKAEKQFSELFHSAKARGFKTWEIVFGGSAVVATVGGFILNLVVLTRL